MRVTDCCRVRFMGWGVLPRWHAGGRPALPARWLSGLCSSVCTDASAVIYCDFIPSLGVWSSTLTPHPTSFLLGHIFFLFFFSGTSWLFYPFALSYPFSNCLVKFKFLKDRSFCFTEKRRKEEWHFSNFLGEIKFHFSLGALSMWPWKF